MKLYLLLPFIALSYMPLAFAEPGSLCVEQAGCEIPKFLANPFSTVMDYMSSFIGATMTLTIIWGVLLGVLWIWTESPMLVMIIGIIVATTAVGLNQTAVGIGLLIASVGLGLVLFQVIRQRPNMLSF
jgi:hypothetical protein